MKKLLKVTLITLILLTGATAGFYYWVSNRNSNVEQESNKLRQEELDENSTSLFSHVVKSKAVQLITEGPSRNVLVFDEGNVFSVEESTKRKERLERLQVRTTTSFKEPLIAYNPFGTNENTFYLYFETNRKVAIKYNVMTEDGETPDFVRTVYNGSEGNLSKKHEFLIRGLVPGKSNYIKVTLVSESGTELESRIYSYDAKAAGVSSAINVTKGKKSKEESTTGLYFVFPQKQNSILMYDNSGILRGETKVESFPGKRIVCTDNDFYYAVAKNKIVKVNAIGQVTGAFIMKGYEHLDFDFDGFRNLYAVAKKKKATYLLRINTDNGHVAKILKLDKKVSATSIAVTDNSQALIGSNKPAGILKIVNIASNVPKVKYVMGKESLWKETSYKKKVAKLDKKGVNAEGINLLLYHAGQKNVTLMHNNNSQRDKSFYVEYKFSEDKKAYSLAKKMEAPFSARGGSGQLYNNHYIICSGDIGIYGEYAQDGNLIKEFNTGFAVQSAIKMDLKRICFY